MWKHGLKFGSALAVLAATAAAGPAQERPAAPTRPADAQQAHRAKDVLGTKVSIQGNVAIGTVDDIVFSDDGYVEYLIVNSDNKLVTVPWEAAKFNFSQRTATVNITAEKFKAIPTYTVQEYPQFFAPTYRTEVYRYYGLTPRQERRIERKIDRKLDRRD